jgi:hypothetical protein
MPQLVFPPIGKLGRALAATEAAKTLCGRPDALAHPTEPTALLRLKGRGMLFKVIDRTSGKAELPFEY